MSEMSVDSDATNPATDDFGSRFLEIDDYFDDSGSSDIESPISSIRPIIDRRLPNALTILARHHRNVRKQTCMRPRVDRSDEFDDTTSKIPQHSVKTRLSYHHTQSQLWTLEDISGVQSRNSELTPEQVAARERRIIRRRESAKNKAELLKKQTVEKLLRVNTDYKGGSSTSRGRGRKAKKFSSHQSKKLVYVKTNETAKTADVSISSDFLHCNSPESHNSEKQNHSQMPKDPAAGCVRYISSLRLSTNSLITFPVDELPSLCFLKEVAMIKPPLKQICSICCSEPRRYASPQTGQPLCSLDCYKHHKLIMSKTY